jgi:hypothetical protein
MTCDPKEKPKKPGPEEDRLKLDGDWEESISEAMKKKRPEEGWPNRNDDSENQDANHTN